VTPLKAIFYFRVGDLVVSADALGGRYTFDRDGHRIEIELPRAREDFQPEELSEGESYSALSGSKFGAKAGTTDSLGIAVVKVTVDTEAEVSGADFDEEVVAAFRAINDVPGIVFGEPQYPVPVERAIACIDAAAKLAEGVISEFVTMARAHGQWWLGLSSEPVERERRALLIEALTGEELLGSTSSRQFLTLIGGQAPLSVDDLAQIEERLRAGSPAPIAETLLSDAKNLVAGRDRGRTDPVRAILMAAIACEVKVKANLRERVPEDQAHLIDFILDNREMTVSAAVGLFDKLMKTTQGRSLRESDLELFKDIARLFETRNAVAHHGKVPSIEEGRVLVEAADRAFNWLDGRHAPPTGHRPLYAR